MPKESNWYKIDVCASCEKALSHSQKFRSSGTCPRCGNNSGSTICKTKDVVIKETRLTPWWKFWDKRVIQEGKDDYSKKWLNQLQ